jgi:hypothetical protein
MLPIPDTLEPMEAKPVTKLPAIFAFGASTQVPSS